ncbi:amidohydrolase family protein [Shewanella surugensis]|uniref:Amidohydrolase n=1 Tax=Shewanella surugensis TaxID=212020 RepID=A0ABT0LBE1_9GAMM|nr:amidohydrolase [Shewanella surugensis]MCL1124815.1 amidohydrolase [Shewanella surugensis]
MNNALIKLVFYFICIVMPFQVLAYEGLYNDAEVHLLNYFQQGQGVKSLMTAMDRNKVDHAIVMGIPVMKKNSVSNPKATSFVYGDDSEVYYYSMSDELVARDIEGLPKKEAKRLHLFLNAFNPTDLNAAVQLEREIKYRPGFWQGIGEVLTRHGQLSLLTLGEGARANHPAMMKIYQLAAKYHLPVVVHSNITSEREKNPLYLSEFEAAVSENPQTKIVWAHAGVDSNLVLHQKDMTFVRKELRRMFSQYSNLFILMSWSLKKLMLLPSGQIDPKWLSLIIDYPERFILGSDVLGHFSSQEKLLGNWEDILNMLPEDIARQLAYENMLSILPNK